MKQRSSIGDKERTTDSLSPCLNGTCSPLARRLPFRKVPFADWSSTKAWEEALLSRGRPPFASDWIMQCSFDTRPSGTSKYPKAVAETSANLQAGLHVNTACTSYQGMREISTISNKCSLGIVSHGPLPFGLAARLSLVNRASAKWGESFSI